MAEPIFGIGITVLDNEPRPAVKTDMSVIGLVVTAPDADPTLYPYNDPVQIFSDDATAIAALGLTGTIAGQIDLINAQLGDFEVAARIVIVRVEEGEDDDETVTNLVGSSSLKTGIHALRLAGPKLGIVPRLVGVPNHTWQRYTGVDAIAISGTGNVGYATAPTVSFTGGGSEPGKVLPTAHAVLGSGGTAGKVVSIVIDTPGSQLTAAPVVVLTGGGFTTAATATATIDDLANPVIAALPSVLSALLAHAVVTGPHTTLQAYTDWRETLASDRLIPVETWVKVGVDGDTIDSVGAILGIGVRRDHEFGGRPFHSWANQPVYGIVGPSRQIEFSLTDGATEAQQILSLNGGVIIRGEAGVESAIASGGYVYVGTDNAGEDELWRFYSVKRGRDYIHLMMLKTLRFYLGKYNIDGATINAVVETMKSMLFGLKAEGDILDFKVGFERDQNNAESLRQGRFSLTFKAEEAPVLRFLGIRSARYRPALDALLDDLLAQLDTAL